MIVYAGKARGECVTNSRAGLTSSGPLDHGCGNLVNDRLALRWLLRTHKAPSDEGAVAKRLRERICSVFSCTYQECESFQAFSPPVSFADSPLIRGGHWAAKRSFTCVNPKVFSLYPGPAGKSKSALGMGWQGKTRRCIFRPIQRSGPCAILKMIYNDQKLGRLFYALWIF